MLIEGLPAFIGRMRKVDLPMINAWIVKAWEKMPSDIKRAFLKRCISNMDGHRG